MNIVLEGIGNFLSRHGLVVLVIAAALYVGYLKAGWDAEKQISGIRLEQAETITKTNEYEHTTIPNLQAKIAALESDLIAVDQQDGRAADDLVGQQFGLQQTTREGDDARHFVFAPGGDVQRHHGALREAEEDDLFRQHVFIHHQRIQKGVQILDRSLHAAHAFFFGRAVNPGDREPLEAEGSTGTGFRRIRCYKQRVGQMFAQRIRQAQQIGAIGAIAMQKHHNRAGFARYRLLAAGVEYTSHRIPSLSFATR